MQYPNRKIFSVLVASLICDCYTIVLAEKHSVELSGGVPDLSRRLNSFPMWAGRIANSATTVPSKQSGEYRYGNFAPTDISTQAIEDVQSLPFNKGIRKQGTRGYASSDSDESKPWLSWAPTQFGSAVLTVSNLYPPFGQQAEDDKQTLTFSTRLPDKTFDKDREKRSNVDETNQVKRNIPKGKQKKAKALGRLLMNSVSNKNYGDAADDYMEDEEDDYFKGSNGEKMNWEDYRNEDGASVMELIALNARHKTNMQRAHADEYLYRR